MQRRSFLGSMIAGLAVPALIGRASAQSAPGQPLPIPALMDVGDEAGNRIDAIAGRRSFFEGAETRVLGWSQDYLGPTLRMQRGRGARIIAGNRLEQGITAHWHGLHVPGWQDGGPHSVIAPGRHLEQTLEIDQPAGTYWYHSHVHGRTGEQVYHGLAGLLIIEDPEAPEPGLPSDYGIDDIPLIVQDRRFSRAGELRYDDDGMALMQGFRGDRILVNGALSPVARVPAGLVRLRLLNGSNSRVYRFRFEDGRAFHQVATDAGLLPAPLRRSEVQLAPAERAEIVVDFASGRPARLVSVDVPVAMMGRGMMGGGGMMGGMMGGGSGASEDGAAFEVARFEIDEGLTPKAMALPTTLAGAPRPNLEEPVRRRSFRLNMMMGMGMMGAMFGGKPELGINGKTYQMDRIDQQLRLGETELWEISADMMAHPFHVHGTSFQVVSRNGRAVSYAESGLKDVVWVDGTAEILIRFDRPARSDAPYMYHCHILEHEDAGMMGQFTVS